jgi:hypothetical protein
MVGRYGTNGSFWTARPDLPPIPITNWQIWNEPHFIEFWGDRPWAHDYVKMLKRTYRAIHKADPAARVVLSGLANKSWNYLKEIYRNGGKGSFDYAAIHPFTASVAGVETIIEKARRVMSHYHDGGRQVMVTELSWTSARGKTKFKYGNEQTRKGQAHQLRAAYKLLASDRHKLRLRAVYWYTWLTRDSSSVQPFDYAGVVRLNGNNEVKKKPAYRALRTTAVPLEGCSSKTADAATCG